MHIPAETPNAIKYQLGGYLTKRRGSLTTPIDDEHLAAIGRVSVNFALLEFQLAEALRAALGADMSAGRIVIAHLSFRRMLDVLASLARLRLANDPRLDDLEDVLSAASAAEDSRNQLLHSTWIAGAPHQEVSRFKTTAKRAKGLEIQAEAVSVDRINATAEQIAEATFDMAEVQYWFTRTEP